MINMLGAEKKPEVVVMNKRSEWTMNVPKILNDDSKSDLSSSVSQHNA